MKMAESQAIRNAETFVKNRTTTMIGLSCGNSFFDKVENLQKILEFAKQNSDEIVVFLPAEIYEHNLRAVGSKNPRRSARAKGNNIRNKCQKAIEACGLENKPGLTHVNWMGNVETSPAYVEALNYVTNLYQVNKAFCTDMREATERALLSYRKAHGTGLPEDEGPFDIEEGVVYPLKELAFLFAAPKIYKSCEKYVFIYHKRRSLVPDLAKRWLEKFFDGDYDGIVRPYFGFYILEE